MKPPENRRPAPRLHEAGGAFTLIEVMIAVAIFFTAMFAILGVMSAGLNAASILQRNGPTVTMAVAELTQTNKLEDGYESGNFGAVYPDFSYQLAKHEIATNGLFQVDVTVMHQSILYGSMSIILYRPDSAKK
jgi:type II secretory pathway pseudopilin PulG